MAINGCAGSGKTLLAIEKAIRLDRAGSRTLILCHNPYLADYIRQLTAGTRITVHDFITWIQEVNGNISSSKIAWTRYQEPSGEELTQAFDNVLAKPTHQYDAIVVDEGQDFKEDWWIVAEAALENNQSGIFYVFYDDNQKLLRHVSNVPLIQAPFKLDKNCRNTGQVFRVVKKFHLQAPEVSLRWGKEGVVRKWVYSDGTELRAMEEAIQAASEVVSLDELVVLTTEAGSSQNSILINQEVHVKPTHTWRDEINLVFRGRIELGADVLPSDVDIQEVAIRARRRLGVNISNHTAPLPGWRVNWEIASDSVRLMLHTPAGYIPFNEVSSQHRRDYPVYDDAILRFLSNSDWSQNIPGFRPMRFGTYSDKRRGDVINVSTVASFKGLESDGIVLFVPSPIDDLETLLYVGVSRARFLLHIVLNPTSNARFYQLDELEI